MLPLYPDPLMSLITTRDLPGLQNFLEQNEISLHQHQHNRSGYLHKALHARASTAIFSSLLSHGASPFAQDEQGATVIELAILLDRQDVLEEIARNWVTDTFNNTVLHYAARTANWPLLTAGLAIDYEHSMVNQPNNLGETPILLAVKSRVFSLPVIITLLQNYADPFLPYDAVRPSAFEMAKRMRRWEILFAIADHRTISFNGQNPLHWGITHQISALVERGLQNGVNVNAADMWGETPLHYLLKADSFSPPLWEILGMLLAGHPNWLLPDVNRVIPLDYVMSRHTALLPAVVRHWGSTLANPTALHYAARTGNAALMQAALAAGVSPTEACNASGIVPYTIAQKVCPELLPMMEASGIGHSIARPGSQASAASIPPAASGSGQEAGAYHTATLFGPQIQSIMNMAIGPVGAAVGASKPVPSTVHYWNTEILRPVASNPWDKADPTRQDGAPGRSLG